MSILLIHVAANLISRLSLLPLDGLQLLLVVGAHVTAPAEFPASVLHLGAVTEKRQSTSRYLSNRYSLPDCCHFTV